MPSGSCICGAIKYSYTGSPVMTAICHCLTCRKISSSTYTTTALIPEDSFTLSSGQPKTYTVMHESDMPLTYSFCPECAVVLYKTAPGWPGMVICFAGTLDNGELESEGNPKAELFVKHRVGWQKSMEERGVMQCEAFPPN